MIEEYENGSELESEPEVTEEPETSNPVSYEIMVLDEPRPFLTTNFSDYSVTEGLLLLLLLLAFVSGLYQIIRRAFSWLL